MEGSVSESVGYEVVMPVAFDDAIAKTREALKTEGFGVLTEIDLQAAFKEKLGKEFRRYTILGACNPPLAFAAVSIDPQIGLLLPCNVTVEEGSGESTIVRLVNPRSMLSAAPGGLSDELAVVADDAHRRIERVTTVLRTVKA